MTEARRREIFSKEALSISDVAELYGVCSSQAAKMIRLWKFRAGDRLNIKGKIHVLDYKKALEWNEENEQEIRSYRTVCLPERWV